MTKSILVLHTAHFLLSDAKHLSAQFWSTILPALSLLALSTLALFTCRFHYPRNPYPQNDHYPQFHYTRIKSPLQNTPKSVPAGALPGLRWEAHDAPQTSYSRLVLYPPHSAPTHLRRSPCVPKNSSQIYAYGVGPELCRQHKLKSTKRRNYILYMLFMLFLLNFIHVYRAGCNSGVILS